MNYKSIDFEKMWQDYIESKEGYIRERAFDDEVESEFWREMASKYDDRPTLYDYSKEVFNLIDELIDEGKTLIEIGVGTGKFTIPLSKKCKGIIAIDFSKDMLNVIEGKTKDLNINNISTLQGKWEEIEIDKSDYILSVNSLYRIWNIKDALIKMNNTANEKVIIVRTIQKPFFNELYTQLGESDRTCPDYIYIPNILYSLDICANVKFIDVETEIEFKNIEDIYSKVEMELNKKDLDRDVIDKYIQENLEKQNGIYILKHKTKVEVIYWDV
jgi:2-polyprenyl-3-methyl-5-hydroxy-6-metoxy-1,4-benzoquinol methylase